MTDLMLFLPLAADAITASPSELPAWVERLGLPVVLLLIVLAVQYFKDKHNQRLEEIRQRGVDKERLEWRDDMRQREKELVDRVRSLETQLGSFREDTLLRATLAMEKMNEAVQVMKAERLSTLQCLQAMGCQVTNHPHIQQLSQDVQNRRPTQKIDLSKMPSVVAARRGMDVAGARAPDQE